MREFQARGLQQVAQQRKQLAVLHEDKPKRQLSKQQKAKR
jgi:hypothetical protein